MRELMIDGQVIALLPDNIAEALRRALVEPGAFLNASIKPHPTLNFLETSYGALRMEPGEVFFANIDKAHISLTIETFMDRSTLFRIGEAMYRNT